MAVNLVNLQAYKGEDVTLNVSPSSTVTSKDVTGWSISFQLKKLNSDSALLLGPIAATITNGPQGLFTVTITSAQLQSLAAGLYYYDVWRTDVSSNTALVEGRFSVLPSVRFGV